MQVLSSNTISDALLVSIPRLASILPPDILEALIAARDRETHERAKIVLDQLVLNAQIANEDHVPICQDTGTVWLCLEVGPDIALNANVFSKVDQSVAAGFINSKLRKSVVRDALFDRTNTGEEGVFDSVLSCVDENAANACPPLVVGVGVGGTFDKVAGLSKLALMRPLNVAAPDPETAAFEQELLEAINATGIGAGGLGGDTTALGVRVKTAPCHIAALPVAVNMGCSALRRLTVEL